jgi:hypothetical protein
MCTSQDPAPHVYRKAETQSAAPHVEDGGQLPRVLVYPLLRHVAGGHNAARATCYEGFRRFSAAAMRTRNHSVTSSQRASGIWSYLATWKCPPNSA